MTHAELRRHRFVGQLAGGRLGHAEVDDLGNRLAIDDRDQDIAGLQIAVDDALLVRMLNRLADGHEEFQPLFGRQPALVAELR